MTDSRETEGEKPQSTETGNAMLFAGGGFAAYGTTMAVTTGVFCSACILATPVLLGVGAYQKYKHVQAKKAASPENSPEE